MPAISQSTLLQSLGWAVLNSLWQMALLWVIFQMITRLLTLKAHQKTSLATIFLMGGFGWFLCTLISSYFSENIVNPIANATSYFLTAETWSDWTRGFLPYASFVYLVLLFIPLWQFFRNYRYVQLIREKGLSKIDVGWRLFVRRVSADLGIKKNVKVWLSELVDSPVTIGYLKPIILIPVAAISKLSTQQVEAILLHELSHIRRYDYLFNILINFIRTILYFNPFVRFFVRTIEKEREISCDQMVMQFEYQPHDYASALLLLEKNGQDRQPMILAAAKSNDLLSRVETILGIQRKDKYSLRRLVGALAILICMVSMNAFLFLGRDRQAAPFFGFAQGYNPYYFIGGEEDQTEPEKSFQAEMIASVSPNQSPRPKQELEIEKAEFVPMEETLTHPSNFYHVNYTTPVLPEFSAEEEAKVKETIEATRKILEEKEWKAVQNSYADVLNSVEKAKLKDVYMKELEKVDWNKLETQLRLAYDRIDWVQVDAQVNSSLAQIRLDSIQTSVDVVLSDLRKLEAWMNENETHSVPDTDITLEAVKENQNIARAHLERLKAIKYKKIVKL